MRGQSTGHNDPLGRYMRDYEYILLVGTGVWYPFEKAGKRIRQEEREDEFH